MTYPELKALFRKLKRERPEEDLTAHIIFTEDSFAKPYPLLGRTYLVGSDNKAFWSGMGGYSIFGSCLDGTDQCVRLERYMADEGAADGWRVQECYVLEHMLDANAIADLTRIELEDGTICYGFGSTCIRVIETTEDGRVRLEPLTGNQMTDGQWADLPMDRVHGYCTLLKRYLDRK